MPAGAYADGWTLTLHLRGAQAIDVPGVLDADLVRFAAAGAVTAEWTPGGYAYAIRAGKGADVVEIEAGRLTVAADIAAAGDGFDGRSEAEVALDAINAVLAKRASLDQERYRINNRELWRTPIGDLIKLRGLYRREVATEQARKAGTPMRIGQVRVVMGGR